MDAGDKMPQAATRDSTGSGLTVLLVGNYGYDRQESMQRFAAVLARELPKRGIQTEIIRPEAWFGRLKPSPSGFGKWLGYLDKFVIFPFAIQKKIRALRQPLSDSGIRTPNLVVHICDHSSAPVVFHIAEVPHLVTCHDLLAIRAARGDFPKTQISRTGRAYQRMILKGLKRARNVACVSNATRCDFEKVVGRPPGVFRTINDPLNYPYEPMSGEDAAGLLGRLGVAEAPRFILHVGADVWYKNREGVLDIFSRLTDRTLHLWMVGPPIDRELIQKYGLEGRVRTFQKLGNETLQALYSKAECLLFPSLEEGFGWPIVEGQACGCPVITTNKPPMTEVGGTAAIYIDPVRADAAAAAVDAVLARSPEERDAWCQMGLKNAARFSTERIIGQFIDAYDIVLSRKADASAPCDRISIHEPTR